MVEFPVSSSQRAPQSPRKVGSRLPTFAIIGAMKSGTTSMHHYLDAHPEICMSDVKETNFFIAERNYARGLDWYESLFKSPAKQYGEASPNYTKADSFPDVPERMHATLPNARLIYVLRDPVERMISHYAHRYAKGKETRPLTEALLGPDYNVYLATSCYCTQLQKFLQYYSLERILVFAAEDLRQNRRTVLRRVYEFLDVDAGFDSPVLSKEHHITAKRFKAGSGLDRLQEMFRPAAAKPTPPDLQLDAEVRGKLAEKLAPDVHSLRQLTGERFEQWCI